MSTIHKFQTESFITALKAFFQDLKVPVNYISDFPTSAKEILSSTYKENDTFKLIKDVYTLGIIDDAAFEGLKSIDTATIKSDYDGILLFGIDLNQRDNDLLPTRSQLADIARAFNREYFYTPVVIIFKYGDYIAFANTERMQYKQEWREGEKVGKVTLLRDIDTSNVHSGHTRILQNLEISRSGKNAVNDFKSLYLYWQDVLSVSLLNKVFYKELSNWYFWAIKEVRFPNEPLQLDFDSLEKYDEASKEHKGKNVIRLLTRLLFIWFIKEKGLIPEEIFDEKEIASRFIDGFTPEKPDGIFADGKYSSKYYRAILQNLFFATLNQPRDERQFRSDGKHLNATQLMRYRSYLKQPDYFVELMESKVPFMNGGLFECLDKPHPTLKGSHGGDRIIYVDGFSDRPDNELLVPDFLFFDKDEELDLSKEYGSANSKKEKTSGLFNILKSYKFTITENTPIDEDVALDPELLGKVFENLLASYNPETKTTARKQTGSFYTPREIVNYMVEESLIAYLKNELSSMKIEEQELNDKLHQLVSFSPVNPFEGNSTIQKQLIKALDSCKILDPACGSGAYPMGILQKMVHILHKIDPNNTEWKQRQINRVNDAIDRLELVDDAEYKNKAIKELNAQIKDIEAAFSNNELDYGRKLFLIENCIYGVDIQPIATQISKLRFFISLVVDQKVDAIKDNFGIRPLPNLETKFVAANTLIGLPNDIQGSLFDKRELKKLEDELKKVRHKLFSVKTPSIKRELRIKDKELREEMQVALSEQFGNETAQLLAQWDPYDQNTSSPFFEKEWMFDIADGFDVVIGNPPYIDYRKIDSNIKKSLKKYKISNHSSMINLYNYFFESSFNVLKTNGIIAFITPQQYLILENCKGVRDFIRENTVLTLSDFARVKIFDASTYTFVSIFRKSKTTQNGKYLEFFDINDFKNPMKQINVDNPLSEPFNSSDHTPLLSKIETLNINKLGEYIEVFCASSSTHEKVNIKENHLYYFLQASDIFEYRMDLKECYISIDGYSQNSLQKQMKEVIYTSRMTNNIRATIVDDKNILGGKVNVLYSTNNIIENKFILSLLNSNLINFWYKEKYKIQHMQGGALPINTTEISLIPLPKKLNTQQELIKLVNEIFFYKSLGDETLDLEHQINILVYHLYELSYEEACVIDNGLNKEDFERFRIN